MKYYNIHTHSCSSETNDTVEVKNVIIGKDSLPDTDTCFSCGIHPWYITDAEAQSLQLESLLSDPRVLAVGEAGLDKTVTDRTPLAQQTELFRRQAILAEEYHKPLIIHCVKAWDELLFLRRQIRPAQPWIIHGFRGKEPLARQLLAHGLYLSFGERFQPAALRAAWPDRLLLETDEARIPICEVYRMAAESIPVEECELRDQMKHNWQVIFKNN